MRDVMRGETEGVAVGALCVSCGYYSFVAEMIYLFCFVRTERSGRPLVF